MKRCLPVIILSLFSFHLQAQTITFPKKYGKVFYEVVDTVPGRTKAQLYNTSKLWVFNYFKRIDDVIHLDNTEDGMIVGTASFPFYVKFWISNNYNRCYYTFTITAKDGKYRIQLYDFVIGVGVDDKELLPLEDPKPFVSYDKYVVEVDKEVNKLIADIQFTMREKPDDF